jgi:hypothetical protein
MVVVRNIFRLKLGQANQAIALWKQAVAALQKGGYDAQEIRLLTDFADADYNTVVLESTFDSVAAAERAHNAAKSN